MSDPRLLKTSLTAIALAVLGGTAGAQKFMHRLIRIVDGNIKTTQKLGGSGFAHPDRSRKPDYERFSFHIVSFARSSSSQSDGGATPKNSSNAIAA